MTATKPGSPNREGVISGSVGFGSRALVQLLLFGVTIVATRHLSVTDFGAYSLASLFVILARQLFYVGPYEYMLKAPADRTLYGACFGANLALATLGAVLLGGVCLLSPAIFGPSSVDRLLALLAPSVFLVAVTAWYEAVLLRGGRVRRYYMTTTLGDVVGAAIAVNLLFSGYGVVSLVAQTYARLLSILLLYVVGTGERPSPIAALGRVHEILAWSRARYGAVLLNFTSTYGGDFMLGALLSPAATGLYRASNRIVSTVTDLFAQPLQKIAQTNLSAKYLRDAELGTSWLTMLSGVGAIAWSALLALAILADQIVPFVFGPQWAPAVPIIIVFCVVKAFSLLDAVTTSFLVCMDRQSSMLRIQIGTAVSVLTLSAAASPWGPVTVAIAAGCASVGISAIYGAMVYRLSRAGVAALVGLFRTCAPPLVAVATGLVLLRLALPGLSGLQALLAGAGTTALCFAVGSFGVRHRLLASIGSLGHAASRQPAG